MSKWVNLDDLLKLRQNVRLLDEGGWEDDTLCYFNKKGRYIKVKNKRYYL